jgi:hypothetical protein
VGGGRKGQVEAVFGAKFCFILGPLEGEFDHRK